MTTDGHAPQSAARTSPILDQAFDAGSLYALRAAVAAHASEAGLAPGRADDLVIAVHELAANAVRHGAGHGRLRVWRSDQALRCEITDDGLPETEATTVEPWHSEPGHGLALVRQVADHTTVQTGRDGTSATISFTLLNQAFAMTRTKTGGCTILTLTGPLDVASAAQFTEAVPQGTKLIIDLSALTSWDSAGLAALILARQRVNGRLVLVDPKNHEALAGRFTLAGTVNEAIQKISEP
jgi:anti-anti-sigma factor